MSDPLGLVGRSGAGAGAFGAGGVQPPAGGQPVDPSQPSFKDVLMENLKQVNKMQLDASNAIEDLQTGKRNDLEGVLLATQKADSAFRMLVAVGNKVQAAYDEIKQLRV